MKQENDLITVQQAATLFGVAVGTIRDWNNKGKIQSFRTIGGHRRFSKKQLESILRPTE